ncbi:MAG: hypothetical protein AMXMBFR23_26180 [Chloroflexota bacterium]
MLYSVICRLQRPAAEYPTLSGAIQAVGVANWAVNECTWLVESDRSPDEIRDTLARTIEDDDLALVLPVSVSRGRWTGLGKFRYGLGFLRGALGREQLPLR